MRAVLHKLRRLFRQLKIKKISESHATVGTATKRTGKLEAESGLRSYAISECGNCGSPIRQAQGRLAAATEAIRSLTNRMCFAGIMSALRYFAFAC